MDELLKTLAEQTGLDLSTAKNGLGAVIAFLKEHLPANLFGQVTQAVPDAPGLAESYEANKVEPSGAGGLIAAATGLVGKLLGQGGEGAAQLVKMLESAGLNVGQITSFLPKVLELLKAHLPPDLLAKVQELLLKGHEPAASDV